MQISLTPDGDFLLTYPTGHHVEVPNSPHALDFLYRILYNVQGGIKEARYIGEYPTQAVIDEWTAAAKRKAREEDVERLEDIAQETARKYNIALGELDFTL